MAEQAACLGLCMLFFFPSLLTFLPGIHPSVCLSACLPAHPSIFYLPSFLPSFFLPCLSWTWYEIGDRFMARELWKPYPTGGCKPQELTVCQALLQRCTASGVGGGRRLQVTLAPSLKHTCKTRLLENPEIWPDTIRPQNPTLQTYSMVKILFPLLALWASDSLALADFRFREKQWEFTQWTCFMFFKASCVQQ